MALDEYGEDMQIVGYIRHSLKGGTSLEEAIKDAALEYGKTVEYVKEVYEEESA